MTNFVWSAIIFAAISFSEAYQTYDYGDGIIHKLNIVQDVTVVSNSNYDYLEYLLVARHTSYPLKRSLVQFENLRSSCPANRIQYAKMYLYFAYAHKASFMSAKLVPYLGHTFRVYRVLKPWKEQEATSEYRQSGLKWGSTLLNIGNDAESEPQCEYQCSPTTLYPPRPSGFMEFDVTKAMHSWSKGSPNYGLLVVNEAANGRDIRFYSKSHSNSREHPFIFVKCNNETIQEKKEGEDFTKNVTKSDKELRKGEQNFTANVVKKYVGETGCSKNSNATHSNPFHFVSSDNADVIKIYIGGIGSSQNSDVIHSKPFWLHSFFNAIFASLYLMRL